MKNSVYFAVLLLLVSGCSFYDVEPRYDARDTMVGYYDAEEFSDTYHDITFYTLRISKSGRYNDIYIHNFYGAGIRVYATVSFDEIRIPFQIVDGYEVEGTGIFDRGRITLNYRVMDGYSHSPADYCETSAWRD